MPTVQTANFSATAGGVDYVATALDAISIALPDATADVPNSQVLDGLAPAGQVVSRIFLQAAATRPVTLVPSSGQTVNGDSSLDISVAGLYELISDGVNLLCTYRKLVGAPGWGG